MKNNIFKKSKSLAQFLMLPRQDQLRRKTRNLNFKEQW